MSIMHHTPDGLDVGGGPYVTTPWTTHDVFIGGLILYLIQYSSEVDPPSSWRSIEKPLLDLVGAKSWNDFARKSKSCSVEQGDNFIVTPDERKSDMSFVPIMPKAIALPIDCDEANIGAAVLHILK